MDNGLWRWLGRSECPFPCPEIFPLHAQLIVLFLQTNNHLYVGLHVSLPVSNLPGVGMLGRVSCLRQHGHAYLSDCLPIRLIVIHREVQSNIFWLYHKQRG